MAGFSLPKPCGKNGGRLGADPKSECVLSHSIQTTGRENLPLGEMAEAVFRASGRISPRRAETIPDANLPNSASSAAYQLEMEPI